MKTINLRLTLDVDFDPQGLNKDELEKCLTRLTLYAVNNGLITGDTAATVEKYNFKVTARRSKPKRKPNKTPFLPLNTLCKKCGSEIIAERCSDMTCPFHDHPQSTDLSTLEDVSEQQRRDEKHGLFGDKTDIAN